MSATASASAFRAFAAVFGAVPATADEVRVESENIVLYGDVDPELAEGFVRKMELYRRMIFALAGTSSPTPDARKLTVHGFPSQRGVQAFAGRDDIGGVYTRGRNGPVFLTPVDNVRDKTGWADFVALHEYGHHILHDIVEESFPRWYDEGFANYLATLQISDERVTVGAPTVPAAENFDHRTGWLDPAVVIGSVTHYPKHEGHRRTRAQKRQHFYAQSWLYVHYLQSHPELGRKLPDYLAKLERGVEPVEAFEQGFGVGLAEFHELAETYWDDNAFEVVAFAPQGDFLDVDVTVTPISKSDLALAELPAQIEFGRDGNTKRLKRLVASAAKAHAGAPEVVAARAALAVADETFEEGVAIAGAALAADPDNLDLHRILADARFHLLQSSGANAERPDGELRTFPVGPEFDAMVAGFSRVLAELPGDRVATTRMLTAYATSDAPMTAVSREVRATFEDAYMGGEPWRALDLAILHHKDGQTARACRHLDTARTIIEDPKTRSPNWQASQLEYAEEKVMDSC